MKRIVLLGKNGQLGWELQRSLAPVAEVIAIDRLGLTSRSSGVHDQSQSEGLCGDLGRLEALEATLRRLSPDVIVNAAGYTSVDKAETETEVAEAINARAAGALARLCAEYRAWLVHYSTDYVFDGSGERQWREDDRPSPLNVYGRTKLHGEEQIRASGCRHLIFRTSWVFAVRGANFAKAVLQLATERDELRIVNDQVGAPTGAPLLADITVHALRAVSQRPELGGTYHAVAAGETTRFGYGCFVIEQARALGWPVRIAPAAIASVSSSAYSAAAERPKNSRLSCGKLERAFDLRMPPWQEGVERLVAELAHRGSAW